MGWLLAWRRQKNRRRVDKRIEGAWIAHEGAVREEARKEGRRNPRAVRKGGYAKFDKGRTWVERNSKFESVERNDVA